MADPFRDQRRDFAGGRQRFGQAPQPPFVFRKDHPLGQSLLGYFPIGLGVLSNMVTGADLTPQDASPTQSWTHTDAGPAIQFSGNSGTHGYIMSGPTLIFASGGTRFTIFGIANTTGNLVPSGGTGLYSEQGTAVTPIIKLCWVGGTGVQGIVRNDAGNTFTVVSNPGAETATHSWAFTKDISGGGGLILYKDGVSVATAAWSKADTFTTTSIVPTVGGSQPANESWPGSIVMCAVWSRVLSRQEILFMDAYPWSFLVPVDTRVGMMRSPPPPTVPFDWNTQQTEMLPRHLQKFEVVGT